MKVLVVEPLKPCYVREIEGLQTMQEIVGGHIEAIYPYEEPVAIIANEEAKLLGLPFNRPLLDEHGVPYDIVCGTFFVTGLGEETFVSLTDDQIRRYKELFDSRMVLTVPEKTQEEKLYFAYGMNVNLKKMARVCPDAHVVSPAVLEDHELIFRGNTARKRIGDPCAKSWRQGAWRLMEDHTGGREQFGMSMRDIRICIISGSPGA